MSFLGFLHFAQILEPRTKALVILGVLYLSSRTDLMYSQDDTFQGLPGSRCSRCFMSKTSFKRDICSFQTRHTIQSRTDLILERKTWGPNCSNQKLRFFLTVLMPQLFKINITSTTESYEHFQLPDNQFPQVFWNELCSFLTFLGWTTSEISLQLIGDKLPIWVWCHDHLPVLKGRGSLPTFRLMPTQKKKKTTFRPQNVYASMETLQFSVQWRSIMWV